MIILSKKRGTSYFFWNREEGKKDDRLNRNAWRRLYGEKTVRRAERALRGAKRRSNLSNRERRANPWEKWGQAPFSVLLFCPQVENVLFLAKWGLAPFIPWGKSNVFLNQIAWAFFLVFSPEKKYNPLSIHWLGFSSFMTNRFSGKEVISSWFGQKFFDMI